MNSLRGLKRKQKEQEQNRKKQKQEQEQYKISKNVDFIMGKLPLELQMEVLLCIPINMTFDFLALEYYKDHFLYANETDVLQYLPNKFRHDHLFMNQIIKRSTPVPVTPIYPEAREFILEPNLELNDANSHTVQFSEKQFHYYRKTMLKYLHESEWSVWVDFKWFRMSEGLMNDREIVFWKKKLPLPPRHEHGLLFTSEELQNDREVVLAAVQQEN